MTHSIHSLTTPKRQAFSYASLIILPSFPMMKSAVSAADRGAAPHFPQADKKMPGSVEALAGLLRQRHDKGPYHV